MDHRRDKGPQILEPSVADSEGHLNGIMVIVFSSDGKFVVSASINNTVRPWDSSSGTTLPNLEGHLESVNTGVFPPDGKLVASAS